jgi:hypothetical protein
MKKQVLLFLSLLGLSVGNALAETVILDYQTTVASKTENCTANSGVNLLSGQGEAAGYSLFLSGNLGKTYQSGGYTTINSVEYQFVKLSNGAKNTIYIPSGKQVDKLTLTSYINKDKFTSRSCYWSSVAGVSYTVATTDTLKCLNTSTDYDVREYSFEKGITDSLEFNNSGEQLYVIVTLEVSDVQAEVEEPTEPAEPVYFTTTPESGIVGKFTGFNVAAAEGYTLAVNGRPKYIDIENSDRTVSISGSIAAGFGIGSYKIGTTTLASTTVLPSGYWYVPMPYKITETSSNTILYGSNGTISTSNYLDTLYYIVPDVKSGAGDSISPLENTVASINAFNIEFPNTKAVTTTMTRDNAPKLVKINKDGSEVTTSTYATISTSDNKLSMKLYSDITKAGTYELRIDGTSYSVDEWSGADLVYPLTIAASDSVQKYTIAPEAEEGTVSTISPIVVTFPNASEVVANTSASAGITVTLDGTAITPSEIQIQNNTILIFIGDDAAEGTYKLNIPAGAYYLDDVENDAIEETLVYAVPKQDYAFVGPEQGEVEGLQSFTVTFPNATSVATTFSSAAYPKVYSHADDANVASWAFSGYSVEENKLTLTMNQEIVKVGVYDLIIPGGSYTVDGVAGEDLTFSYTVVPSDKTLEYNITPTKDEDGIVSTISPIVVTFPNVRKIEVNAEAGDYDYAAIYAFSKKSRATTGWIELLPDPETYPDAIQVENNTIKFFIPETEIGSGRQYALTIPEGTYLIDGVKNPLVTDTLTYVEPQQDYAVLTPASGSYEGLQNFTVEFPGATAVEATFSQTACPTLESSATGSTTLFTNAIVDGNKLTISLNAPIYYVGTYKLTIPAASYTLDGVTGTEDIVGEYTIVASDKTLEYTIAPSSDSIVNDLSHIVVTFPNVLHVAANPNFDTQTASDLLKLEYLTARNETAEAVLDTTIQNNQLIISVAANDLLSEGEFDLTIPAGLLLLDGVENPAIADTFIYEILVPEVTISVTPDAETAVNKLDAIVLTVDGADEVSFNTTGQLFYIMSDTYAMYSANATVEDNQLILIFDPNDTYLYDEAQGEVKDGTYTLYIPANVIVVNGVAMQDRLEYTIVVDSTNGVATGINAIANDARAKGAIYDLRGIRITNKTLAPGLYLMDGKKVLVR